MAAKMAEHNEGGLFGRVIVPPVQSEEKRTEGTATSFRLPLLQALALAGSATILTLLIGLVARDVGELVFWLPTLIVATTTFIWKLWRESRGGTASILGLVAAIVFALLAGLVGLAARQVAGMLGSRPLYAVPLIFFGYLTPLLALPFLQELALRSPFIEKAVGDIATAVIVARHANPPEPVETAIEVIRPVPVHNGNGASAELAALPDEDAGGQGKLWRAPDGTLVRFADLRRYVEQAAIVGPGFAGWKARGWGLAYWSAVVDTLALYGIVTERKERVPTRLLVEPQEALGRLMQDV